MRQTNRSSALHTEVEIRWVKMSRKIWQQVSHALILQFAFPLLIGNFFQQMYNVADAAIVGRFLGPKALAAVGASSSVQFWYLDFASASVVDLEFLSLNALAARITDPCAPISGTAFLSRLLPPSCWQTICALLCPAILHILTTPANIYKDAYIYLLIIFLGIPCTLLYNLLSSILRAVGDSKTPFFIFGVFHHIKYYLGSGLHRCLSLGLCRCCNCNDHRSGDQRAALSRVYTKEGTDTASNCRGSRFSPTDGIASAYHGDPYGTAIFHYSDRQYGHAVRQQRTGWRLYYRIHRSYAY